MSGTFPSTPQPTDIKFNLQTPVLKTTTISGKTRRVAMGIQYYTMTLRFGSMTSSQMNPIQAFIASQYGAYDSFQIVLPKISYRKATDSISTTPTATASVSAGATSLKVTTDNNKTVLKAGDFFKFANHTKVYMANTDFTSTSTGTGVLSFTPALVNDVTSSEALTITAVPFTVILDNEEQSFTVGVGGITTTELELREVF